MAHNYRNQSGRPDYGRGGRNPTGSDQDRYSGGGEQRFNPEWERSSNEGGQWQGRSQGGRGFEGDRSYSPGGYSEEFGYRGGRNRDEQNADWRGGNYQSRGSSGANYQGGRGYGEYGRASQSRYDEGRFDEANRWSEGASGRDVDDTDFGRDQRTPTSSWREDQNDAGGYFNTGNYIDDGGASRSIGDDFNRAYRQAQQRYSSPRNEQGESSYAQGYYGGSRYGSGFSRNEGAQAPWRSQQGRSSYQDRSGWNYEQNRGQRAGSGSSGGAYGNDQGAYRSDYSSYAGTQSHKGRGPQGYQRSDDRLKEMICERLTDDPAIDASNVTVDVTSQVVKLTGTVDDRSTKYEIEELVESLGGVKDIDNQLRVQSRWNQSSATSNQSNTTGQQARGGSDWEAGSSSLSSTGSSAGRSTSASSTSGTSTTGSTSPSKRN